MLQLGALHFWTGLGRSRIFASNRSAGQETGCVVIRRSVRRQPQAARAVSDGLPINVSGARGGGWRGLPSIARWAFLMMPVAALGNL